MHANLVEVFSSVQGEGIHVGASTLFVRFGECDLRCRWCDSPHTWQPAARCRLETARGTARFREIGNPVAIDDALVAVGALEAAAHRFVAFTGGEPLLQPGPVAALAEALRGGGPRMYLETHGLASRALERVVERMDVIAMDWKLASDVRRAAGSASAAFHDEHEAFLRVAIRAPEVMVKVVVTPHTTDDEIDETSRRIAAVDPNVPLVLQPVTPMGGVRERPTSERLLAMGARLESSLADVRIVPQTHPSYGAL